MASDSSGKRFRFECPENVMFECNRCALCCGDTNDRIRNVRLLKIEVDKIAKDTGKDVWDFAESLKGPGPYKYRMKKQAGKCVFLENGLCSVYATRPLTCRFYPFELREIDDGRKVFSFTDECPCIGRGGRLERGHFEDLFMQSLATFAQNNQL